MNLAGLTELATLGTGAQGRVALARDAAGNVVAVKHLTVTGESPARARFRDEARMMARLRHPHIVAILGYEEDASGAAIVMEAVPGVSLAELLRDQGELPPEAALTVLKGSLLGLGGAHSVGVVHRDYKPSNVMVTEQGESKLVDFGIAVFAGRGGREGTPAYMAPEQWEGAPASPATDVYAATAVFFECVTGRRPFEGAHLADVEAGHRTAPVPEELAPEGVRPLLRRGLAKDPAGRPADAAEFVAELERAAADAYGPGWERRGALALAGTAAALVAALPWLAAGGAAVPSVAVSTAVGTAGRIARFGLPKAAVAAAGTLAVVGTAAFLVVDGRADPEPAAAPTTAVPAGLTITFENERRTSGGAVSALVVPHAAGLPTERLAALNASLQRPITDYLTLFTETNRDALAGLDGRQVLTTTARLVRQTKDYLSLRYTFAPIDQAAQHASWWRTINADFDLRTGAYLRAADLYRPQTLTRQGLVRLAAVLAAGSRDKSLQCKDQLRFLDATMLEDFSPAFTGKGVRYDWYRCAPITLTYQHVAPFLRPEIVAGFRS